MSIEKRDTFASLAAAAWLVTAVWLMATDVAAQGESWAVEVSPTRGALTADVARPVIEAARERIARCVEGAGPHRFQFALAVRPSGQVRTATADRRSTTDAGGARCIRRALLLLRFPAPGGAAALSVVLSAGAGAPPPSTPAAPEAPVGPAGPIATPAPIPTPMPAPQPTDAPPAGAEVNIGAVAASTDRTAAQLLAVITPQRASLLACYTSARATDAALAGEAMLHLTVAPDGHVTNAMFQGPEAIASALAPCVGRVARAWTFGATAAEARISVPLTFGAARPVRH